MEVTGETHSGTAENDKNMKDEDGKPVPQDTEDDNETSGGLKKDASDSEEKSTADLKGYEADTSNTFLDMLGIRRNWLRKLVSVLTSSNPSPQMLRIQLQTSLIHLFTYYSSKTPTPGSKTPSSSPKKSSSGTTVYCS